MNWIYYPVANNREQKVEQKKLLDDYVKEGKVVIRVIFFPKLFRWEYYLKSNYFKLDLIRDNELSEIAEMTVLLSPGKWEFYLPENPQEGYYVY